VGRADPRMSATPTMRWKVKTASLSQSDSGALAGSGTCDAGVCPHHLAVHLAVAYCGVTDRQSSVTGFCYQFSAPENGSLKCPT
jgi:hypothetical protein